MAHPTRLFKKPEELQKVFEDYKDDVKEQSNEWLKVMYVGKDATRTEEAQKVPYTFEGLKRFARKNHGEIEQYFLNTGGYYTDFVGICRAIKEEIRENQIIGGMLNFYNPSITQRLNHLGDNLDLTSKGEKITKIERVIVDTPNNNS